MIDKLVYTMYTKEFKVLLEKVKSEIEIDIDTTHKIFSEYISKIKVAKYPFTKLKPIQDDFKVTSRKHWNEDLERLKKIESNLEKHCKETIDVPHNLLYNLSGWANSTGTKAHYVRLDVENHVRRKYFSYELPNIQEIYDKYDY